MSLECACKRGDTNNPDGVCCICIVETRLGFNMAEFTREEANNVSM